MQVVGPPLGKLEFLLHVENLLGELVALVAHRPALRPGLEEGLPQVVPFGLENGNPFVIARTRNRFER